MTATVYIFPTGEALAPVIPLWGGTVNAVPDTAKGTKHHEVGAIAGIAAWSSAGRPQNFPGGDAA